MAWDLVEYHGITWSSTQYNGTGYHGIAWNDMGDLPNDPPSCLKKSLGLPMAP